MNLISDIRMKKEAWQVAELLEEIAKKADPLAVKSRFFQSLLNGESWEGVGFNMQTDYADNTLTARYFVPVEVVMKDAEGTPDDVINWLTTGLGPNQSVYIDNRNFVIEQKHQDEHLIEASDLLSEKLTRMQEKKAEEQKPQ